MVRLAFVFFLTLMSACALSPQQVELVPQSSANNEGNIGHNASVQVIGQDGRSTKVIGSRGGVYNEKSQITASNDVAADFVKQVRKQLQTLGFNALNPVAGAPQLVVSLESLAYVPASGYVINRIQVSATIKAELRTDEGNFTRTYSSDIEFKQPVTPTADKNQEMLNQVLSRCLDKLTGDSELLQRIATSATVEVSAASEFGSAGVSVPTEKTSWVF